MWPINFTGWHAKRAVCGRTGGQSCACSQALKRQIGSLLGNASVGAWRIFQNPAFDTTLLYGLVTKANACVTPGEGSAV